MKLLTIALLLASTTAMAKTVHVYKCSGAADTYVSVDLYNQSNDTAYVADGMCKDIHPELSAHVMNSVVTTVDDFAKVDLNNAALGKIYYDIKIGNERYRLRINPNREERGGRRFDIDDFCTGLERLNNQNGYQRSDCIM